MVKLIAIYSKPEDAAAFDKHYHEIHAPLAAKMPGLRKMVLNRITGSPAGPAPFHLIAELWFDNAEALKAAMKSPEGAATAKDVMSFAGKYLQLVIADVEER